MKRFVLAAILFLNVISTVTAEEELAPKKHLRFFTLDYHSSATADVMNIFEALGHEVVYWSISPYSQRIFGHDNHPVEILNHGTWINLNTEMCNRFYERYRDFLSQFDGFIVTAFSSFALVFEKFDKPIIIVNSSRYEMPFTDKPDYWNLLNRFLIDGVNRNKVFVVANNIGDVEYLKRYTGIESEFIPSLCLYTKAEYTGKMNGFIFHNPRCAPFINEAESFLSRFGLIMPYPYNHKSFQTMCDYKGIIHIPYQISIMSLFEQYSANIPLFFPTKNLLFSMWGRRPSEVLNEISAFKIFNSRPPPTIEGDLNNLKDPNVIKFWIDTADFYDQENMPHIQYFHSYKHLEELLRTVDTQEISRKMKEHNVQKKKMVFEKWKQLLEKIALECNKED